MRRQVSVTQDTDKDITTPVDPALLEVLVCPVTRGPLIYDQAHQELISQQARKAYPIRAGVPIMLVDEARDLDQ
ncbi:MAG: Trm112 family protein [Candidatus Puniceispirillum sp.]